MLVAIRGIITRKISLNDTGFAKLHVNDGTDFNKVVVGSKFETYVENDSIIVIGELKTDPKYGSQIKSNHIWLKDECPFLNYEDAIEQLSYLHETLKLPVWLADAVFNAYLDHSKEVIQNNPYRLATEGMVSRVGVKTVDKYFSEALGIDKRDRRRLRASILDTLRQAKSMYGLAVYHEDSGLTYGQEGGGHSYVDYMQLVATCAEDFEVSRKIVGNEIKAMAAEERSRGLPPLITIEKEPDEETGELKEKYIYQYGLAIAERGLAFHIGRIRDGIPDRDLAGSKYQSKVELSDEQDAAVRMALENKLSIVTGGPGVGKTTIISTITSALKSLGVTFCLCAPTGIASQRMSISSGDPASTIHRLLKYNPHIGGFTFNAHNPLQDDFIICDESSMVDTTLMFNLIQAVKTGARLLFVGDVDQLPPVGAGAPFRDLIRWNKIPIARLNKIYRQELANSLIIQGSRAILEKKEPTFSKDPKAGDLFAFPYSDETKALTIVTDLVVRKITENFGIPTEKIQVICPHRRAKKRNAKDDDSIKLLAAEHVNKIIQQKIHGSLAQDMKFTVGDRVIQTKNNYELETMNGEIGYVTKIDVKKGRGFENAAVTVKFPNKSVAYKPDQVKQLDLAYAMSVHKSQGTEHEAVIVIAYGSQRFFSRNMLYTAITRGKRIVIIVSPKGGKSFRQILTTEETIRNSRLTWRLENPALSPFKNEDWLGNLDELSDEDDI